MSRFFAFFCSVLLLFCTTMQVSAFLPVIMYHGLNGYVSQYAQLANWIRESHPGTQVFNLDIDQGKECVYSSGGKLLAHLRAEIEKIKQQNNITEHHLLCHSQGALFCRAYIQSQNNHTVRNFVSLTGPHLGEFGLTSVAEHFLPAPLRNISREEVYLIIYDKLLQDNFTPASYFRDPLHYDKYVKGCQFLPMYNNETNFDNAQVFRSNFLRINRAIFTGSPQDGIIEPWQSALFGFWKLHTKPYEMQDMKQQLVYEQDTFGLRTMVEQGRLELFNVPNAYHSDWQTKQELYTQYVEPYLY